MKEKIDLSSETFDLSQYGIDHVSRHGLRGRIPFDPTTLKIISNPFIEDGERSQCGYEFYQYVIKSSEYSVLNSNMANFLVTYQDEPEVGLFLNPYKNKKALCFFGDVFDNVRGITCIKLIQFISLTNRWESRTIWLSRSMWSKELVALVYQSDDLENGKPKIPKYTDLRAVYTIECGEKMINISKELTSCICEHSQSENIPYLEKDIWVRETIALKLDSIAQVLLKKYHNNYRLKILYGYRNPRIQREWFNKIKDDLHLQHLAMDEVSLNELANTMVANPETAGHPTGGAVDVTISNYRDLDMGTEYADFRDPEKFKMYSEKITGGQMWNRMFLHDLMVEEGFAPYYGEWWHYSYGDKEWAWFYKKPNALYEQIEF